MSLPYHSEVTQRESAVTIGSDLVTMDQYLESPDTPRIFINDITPSPDIYPYELTAIGSVPVSGNIDKPDQNKPNSLSTGIVVLPVEGGGRGPTASSSGEISTEIILSFLSHALNEDYFTTAYNDHIDVIRTNVDHLQNNYSAMYPRIVAVENRSNSHTYDINNLQSQVSAHHDQLATIDPLVNQNRSRLDILEPTVTQHTSDITSLRSDFNSVDSRISNNTAGVAHALEEVSDVDDALLLMAQDVTDNSQHVNDMVITVQSNTDQIQSNTESIRAINASLGNATSSTSRKQEGFAIDGDIIHINYEWTVNRPVFHLYPSHGVSVVNPVTVDQELIFGHTGLVPDVDDYKYMFGIHAAICEYAAPTVVALDWRPTNPIGIYPPGTEVPSDTSTITTTTNNCIGLRVKGELGLYNDAAAGVGGYIYAQIAVDTPTGGTPEWINIAELYAYFPGDDEDWVESSFDVQLAYTQAQHTYQFRALIVTNYAGDNTRELTGAIHIDTVTESGSGTVLSTAPIIKWQVED
jgi:hypothetical protein